MPSEATCENRHLPSSPYELQREVKWANIRDTKCELGRKKYLIVAGTQSPFCFFYILISIHRQKWTRQFVVPSFAGSMSDWKPVAATPSWPISPHDGLCLWFIDLSDSIVPRANVNSSLGAVQRQTLPQPPCRYPPLVPLAEYTAGKSPTGGGGRRTAARATSRRSGPNTSYHQRSFSR